VPVIREVETRDHREAPHLADDQEMRQQSANTVARHSRRGWRLDAPACDVSVDSIVSLAMALEHPDAKAGGFEFLGYLDEFSG